MSDLNASSLVDEILCALDTQGEIESWIDQNLNTPDRCQHLVEAYGQATQRLLAAEPPKTDRWEHLLFATALHSAKLNHKITWEACKMAIAELTRLIEEDCFASTDPGHLETFASALTMVLSAQRRLRQPIEISIFTLHEKFPDLLPVIAEQCQDIWQRHGQMSGLEGLFFWDIRNRVWRLSQDFKSHCPD